MGCFLLLVASSIYFAQNVESASFVSIGDWGGASLEGQHAQNVADVASAMATVVESSNAEFVVNTGDNFYYCGIIDVTDYQVDTDWVEPYAKISNLDWYNSLGNHEYSYNVQAQIDLSESYPHWIMDDRYYTRRVEIGETAITFIIIDTSPCVQQYRDDNDSGWDPCSDEYPTCSLHDTDDDFEAPCNFHQNILTQNCTSQYTWFKAALEAVSEDDWLIVIGHHPADEIDVEDFTSLMQAHGFDLYLNGHVHLLSQYTIDNAGAYVTTGAGSMVDTKDQTHVQVIKKSAGLDIPVSEGTSGHSYQTVWTETVAGFTLHTFSSDYTQLTTDFYSYQGEVIHSFTVTKRGSSPPAADDDDDDDSGGTSSRACCHYDDSSCNTGDVCCLSNCDDPDSCSYSEGGCSGEYGQIHDCQWNGQICTVGGSTIMEDKSITSASSPS